MRILFATHRYFPVAGGTERVVQVLAEGAVRAGHAATVVTQQEAGVPDEEVVRGVRVVRLRMRHLAGIRVPAGYRRALRDEPADVFHLHGNRIWCADFYLPRARSAPWPQVMTGHGFYQFDRFRRWYDRWYFERYLPRRLRWFDRYVPLTRHEEQQLLDWKVPAARLTRIPNGVELDEFRSPGDGATLRSTFGVRAELLAVYAGGFFENKRVDRLVQAVAQAGPRWGLLALGNDVRGSRYGLAACTALARSLGVEFHAPGVLSRADTVRAISGADVVVSGSDYEGFGLTPLEAMAAGRPFIAFPTGAAPEIAASGGGFVETSVPAFAARLHDLEDPERRAAVGAAGRHAVPDWSTDVMVRRHLDLYERVLRDRSAEASGAGPSNGPR